MNLATRQRYKDSARRAAALLRVRPTRSADLLETSDCETQDVVRTFVNIETVESIFPSVMKNQGGELLFCEANMAFSKHITNVGRNSARYIFSFNPPS